jgi:hypothetical protein
MTRHSPGTVLSSTTLQFIIGRAASGHVQSGEAPSWPRRSRIVWIRCGGSRWLDHCLQSVDEVGEDASLGRHWKLHGVPPGLLFFRSAYAGVG